MNRKFQTSNFKLFIYISLFLLILAGQAFADLTVDANHSHIKIDFFYHGSTMSVRGTSDPGVDLIIKLSSPEGHETLKQKGKVAGVLWMNVGTLNIEDVPGVYFLHSTKRIEDILNAEEMQKYVIGYAALAKHIRINPIANNEDKDRWFKEFVKFKENSKLYSTSTGKISFTEKDGKGSYYILTDWPYQVPPGIYTVTVYAVKDRHVVETAQTNIMVEQVGIVRTLASMAKNNGAVYGIISIVVALIAGFGVGIIFRKGGGAH
ncbi:hypothetical protein JZK55_06270 [Dissulfurispira thermophila]|uniref:Transmembrane protein n=2 Tax=root TaxID=1 RepID=A0A7G1GZ04_9BACT|nr:TIGR02186 family protein [Dissulfurispira thermophila]BCB95705.1 hypothetical protein JZK55_06270 [Dissulfurispira thermophila]